MVSHTFNAIEGLISEVFTKYYKVLLYFIYIGLFPQRYFVPSWFGLMGLHAIQVTLFPMAGIGLQRCLYEGCDVKIKSSVFSFLVGKSIICSKPLADAIARYVWFVPTVYWFELIVCSDQFISGRLKSPLAQIFLFCVYFSVS
jgi:hypothetical protein